MISQCLGKVVVVCQQPDHSPAQSHHSDEEDTYLGEVGGTTGEQHSLSTNPSKHKQVNNKIYICYISQHNATNRTKYHSMKSLKSLKVQTYKSMDTQQHVQ